ncbi:MAG: glycosyltransferase involved in cell wall biosynthesis [Crocinitomix sp.]|jgi:glycosyltransferase involved in cell wall biosynthesis
MRLLILSDLNSIHTKKWISGLSARGCDIMVFGLSKPLDDYYDRFENVQIGFANQTGFRERSLFSKLGYLKQIKQLRKLYRLYKPDIVHAHYATSYGLLGSLLRHKPFIISVWGTEIFDFPKSSAFNKFILKRNLSKATHLFSTSEVMAKETNLYTAKKVEVVPFGVDLERFKSGITDKADQSEKLVIGIVKTLEKNYAINDLIAAFKIIVDRFPKQLFELHIVGEGREEDVLKKQTNELGLGSRVIFKGFINHDLVPSAFNQMDIVVIASLTESFGVSAVEAAACKKPVVATRVGGLPEVVIDQKTGLLCEPNNPSDMADKIAVLVEDQEKRKSMGEAGRISVFEKYDWEKNVDQMYDHYRRIASS